MFCVGVLINFSVLLHNNAKSPNLSFMCIIYYDLVQHYNKVQTH